jgi:hypothetical protein
VTQAPTWEKERIAGIRVLLRAIAEGKPDAPDQILARWTWRLERATRKVQDRRASGEYPEAKRLLGALANSRGHRHEENAAKLVQTALEQPIEVGAALLASGEGYTPRATKLLDDARERLGEIKEVAAALAENLPAPKQPSSSRRRRRRRKKKVAGAETPATTASSAQKKPEEQADAAPKRRRRRRKPSAAGGGEQAGAGDDENGSDHRPPGAAGHEGAADRADALPEENGAGHREHEPEAARDAAKDHG